MLFLYLIIDSKPKANSVKTLTSNSAEQAQASFKKIYSSFLEADRGSTLSFNRDDLSSLSSTIHHTAPKLMTKFRLFEDSTQVVLSYQIADSEHYFNISTLILSSQNQLQLGKTNIGKISFDGQLLLDFTSWAINTFVKDEFGDVLMSIVTQVDSNSEEISIHYALPQVDENSDDVSLLVELRNNLSLFGDVNSVQYYLNELLDFASMNESLHLIDFLTFILTTAHDYPLIKNDEAQQNYSALMALVLYFGHDKFQLLVGDFKPLSINDREIREKNRANVVFGDRVDLQKHVVYSIAIQLFVNDQTSDAMGVFKELLDANTGGSGFSFADILADRVGTSLAVTATKNNETAFYVQQKFARLSLSDSDMLPDFSDLPEGLGESSFQQTYIDIKSVPYKQMLIKINQRLLSTKLYNGLL